MSWWKSLDDEPLMRYCSGCGHTWEDFDDWIKNSCGCAIEMQDSIVIVPKGCLLVHGRETGVDYKCPGCERYMIEGSAFCPKCWRRWVTDNPDGTLAVWECEEI